MRYIHRKKIAHLDLKPMNIYVTAHAIMNLRAANYIHVKIGDFGTAIKCDDDGPIPDWVYGQGTASWRAPELFKEASRRSDLDLFKADVYSYAMVCVELVVRQLPLQDKFPKIPTSSYEYISVEKNRPSLPDITHQNCCPLSVVPGMVSRRRDHRSKISSKRSRL